MDIKLIGRFLYLEGRHWVFQSQLYARNVERVCRWMIECTLVGVIYCVMSAVVLAPTMLNIAMAFAMSHTLMWMLVGNHMVILKVLGKTSMGINDISKTISHIREVSEFRGLGASKVVAFGSLSRSESNEKSDLDLRIIAGPRVRDVLRCFSVLIELKLYSLVERLPLDVYMLKDERDISKHIRSDERRIYISGGEEVASALDDS